MGFPLGAVAGNVAAPFDPIAGLNWSHVFWAEGAQFKASGPVNDGAVATWHDEAGTRDVAQASGAAQPLYQSAAAPLNDRPALQFNGTSHYLTTSTTHAAIPQPFSIVAVHSPSSVASEHVLVTDLSNAGRLAQFGSRGRIQSDGSILEGNNSRLVVDEGSLQVGYFDGAASVLEVNRERTAATIGTSSLANNLLRIGARTGAYFAGHIAFVGIYAGDVRDDPNWNRFEGWATTHYGVPFTVRPGPAGNIGSGDRIIADGDTLYAGNPIASYATGTYDAFQLRESGNALYDPATDQWVVCYTGLNFNGGSAKIGLSFSPDGLTGWTPAAGNPITGASKGEDPYLAKTWNGQLYRDGSGLAYMYTEEKPGGEETQRGVELWRSGANSLDTWTYYGRVIDGGATGEWDDNDRTSPVVIVNAGAWTMLWEGRSAGNEGEIGVGWSSDGITWTLHPVPIIKRGPAGTWSERAIVPDDVILVNGRWILTAHGARVGQVYRSGRWATSDAPADWDETSFVELPGNPYNSSNTCTYWGNDPTKIIRLTDDQTIHIWNVHYGE